MLLQTIDALYAAFAAVRRPTVIAGCPCCIEDKEIAVLLSRPLRELSAEELSSYASSVFLTVGGEEDFRYFVPRILEISATDPGWWPDPEVVARALAQARWQEWPTAQREAVASLWDERFTELIEAAEGSELDSWLCGLARAGFDLSPFLARLSQRPAAVLALYGWHANEIVEHRLANGFWDEAPQGRREVIDWFHSPEISPPGSPAQGSWVFDDPRVGLVRKPFAASTRRPIRTSSSASIRHWWKDHSTRRTAPRVA